MLILVIVVALNFGAVLPLSAALPNDVLEQPLHPPVLTPAKPKGSCHRHGEFPDPMCTPGIASGNK
jgi:hypothetical protein